MPAERLLRNRRALSIGMSVAGAVVLVSLVAAYFSQERLSLPEEAGVVNDMLSVANAENGKELAKACAVCHTLEVNAGNLVGPNLFGIVGAPIGSVAGYEYSPSLKRLSSSKWTIDNLNLWLKDPASFAPGNKMLYPGLGDPQDRMDLVRYLLTLK